MVVAASAPRGHQVVIVGGGFSGAAVGYHLLRLGRSNLTIHLVESGPWIGRGIAYGVESDVFRLNVAASKMSIDPAVPDDFVAFAGAPGNAFLSRALYGRYVTARLAAALRASPAKLQSWRDEAISASETEVVLRSGQRLAADAVVLATGLTPRLGHAESRAGVIDAWDEQALATLPQRGRILIIGSGLTALDVLAFLEAQRFEGDITMISRRGLLPQPHAETAGAAPPLTGTDLERAPRDLRPLIRWVRERIQAPGDGPWQHAVDRIRPHVAALYRGLSAADRARFVRHVRPFWDVVRHRAPADALERVDALAGAGRLRAISGRVDIRAAGAAGVDVEIFERARPSASARFDAVVRCIGPALDVADAETPLLRSLLEAGLARLTPHRLGIETLADGRLVAVDGSASTRIFGIGAVRRASHWETTSVPDIALDARRIAGLVSG